MAKSILKPKMIQLPDYSKYIGKEFIVTEDFTGMRGEYSRHILKGVRFVIKKIKNTIVTIKITNSKQELEELGMLEYDFKRVISQKKSEIKLLKKVCKMWEDEPEKFIVDKNSFWNKDRGDGKGHCINTGYYQISSNHPDKYGMAKSRPNEKDDSIMTLDYKRTDGKANIYSYQENHNEYYSKECYKYMLMGDEVELKDWEDRIPLYKSWVFGWILSKIEITLPTLNKIKFDFYKKK